MCRIKLYNNINNRNIIYIIKVVELTLRMINCGIKESINFFINILIKEYSVLKFLTNFHDFTLIAAVYFYDSFQYKKSQDVSTGRPLT